MRTKKTWTPYSLTFLHTVKPVASNTFTSPLGRPNRCRLRIFRRFPIKGIRPLADLKTDIQNYKRYILLKTWNELFLYQDHCLPRHILLLLMQTVFSFHFLLNLFWTNIYGLFYPLLTLNSGGSRGGARWAPPLFLDQTEARRPETSFFEAASPYLKSDPPLLKHVHCMWAS